MVQLVESFWSWRLFDEEMKTWRWWCRELLVNGEIRVAKEGGPYHLWCHHWWKDDSLFVYHLIDTSRELERWSYGDGDVAGYLTESFLMQRPFFRREMLCTSKVRASGLPSLVHRARSPAFDIFSVCERFCHGTWKNLVSNCEVFYFLRERLCLLQWKVDDDFKDLLWYQKTIREEGCEK